MESSAEVITKETTMATSEATSVASSGTTTGDVRGGDKRKTLNSEHQLQKIVTDHLNAS